ncbi:MAG: hypothetical protein K2L95_03625, partial [Alphaproteobacteria bacterium]|nr:hypothetical protein [Alphaproteobacteria bacterium]
DNGDKEPGISTPLSLRASAARAAIQESGNVHHLTGLLHCVRNDNGDKEPGISTPLSLRASAARAAIQKSGNVHYLLDCFTAFAMTKGIKSLEFQHPCHCEQGGMPPRGNPGKVAMFIIFWIASLRSQ